MTHSILPTLLCVHPNCELYGSDRSFANAVKAFLQTFTDLRTDVLIPQRGPILTLDPFKDMDVRTRDLWILRRRQLVRQFTLGLPGNLVRLLRALRDIRASDLTYINTIVVFDYILAARLAARPVVIHVREIPNGLEMTIFRALLIWSGAVLIFNSEATYRAFSLPGHIRTFVVHNGFADPGVHPLSDYDGRRPLELLIIGRLNHWKGQETVISAIADLPPVLRKKVHCRIVGSVFEQQVDFLDNLVNQIKDADLDGIVEICPFEDDPAPSFRRSDIVLVPSRLPEPFGRVAIEAMAYGRPVLASNHGGLIEIVQDAVTGHLLPPGDAKAMAGALASYLDNPALVRQQGAAGRARFLDLFTEEATSRQLMEVIGDLTTSRSKVALT